MIKPKPKGIWLAEGDDESVFNDIYHHWIKGAFPFDKISELWYMKKRKRYKIKIKNENKKRVKKLNIKVENCSYKKEYLSISTWLKQIIQLKMLLAFHWYIYWWIAFFWLRAGDI